MSIIATITMTITIITTVISVIISITLSNNNNIRNMRLVTMIIIFLIIRIEAVCQHQQS